MEAVSLLMCCKKLGAQPTTEREGLGFMDNNDWRTDEFSGTLITEPKGALC